MARRMHGRLPCKMGIMSFNFVSWILRLFFLGVMIFACGLLIRMFMMERLDANDVKAEIFIGGLMYSKGGVGYYDPLTGRHYPEIIDLSQMDSAELDMSLYYPGNNLITAKVVVFSKDDAPLKYYYYNKEWWDNWAPILKRALPGPGGVTYYQKKLPVIYIDESGEKKMGYVRYEVVQPKS
jgi:hypothetical protein